MTKEFFLGKNILIILHSGTLGGAERQGLGLAKILTEDYNCNCYLLLTSTNEMQPDFKSFIEVCHIQRVFHTHSPYLVCWKELNYRNLKRFVWSIKYIFGYRKLLKPYNIDYIMPFLNFPSKMAFYLYKALPTVKFTFWHQLGLDIFKPTELFERYAAYNVPVVIANSQTGIDLFRNYYRLENSRAYVLPQYLTMQYEYYPKYQTRRKFKIPKNSLVFGMVAHYREDKLHSIVLKAFQILAQQRGDVFLVFLGNRNSSINTKKKYIDLTSEVQLLNLEGKVMLLSGESVESVLSCIDIGLLISEIEGMPNAVMEYMLYGLPVIASNHPGCKQLLTESEFLIENEEDILFKKMKKLTENPNLRIQESKRNRKAIRTFTKEKYMQKLSSIVAKHTS